MEMTMQVLFWEAAKMALVAGLSVYGVLIVSAYVKSGSSFKLELDEHDPLESVANLLVWLGVGTVAGLVRLGRAFVDFLSEPSAEVGEWLISISPQLQQVVERPHRP